MDALSWLRSDGKTPAPHVVIICGGAVAGSEAAAVCAERGAVGIVIEQNAKPYGKIEDGLPRWHRALREKEFDRIDDNLSREGVLFVPFTSLGGDVSLNALLELRPSAVILANGAWRDRPLAIDDAETFVGKGLVYQNPFVYWYNHYLDDGYAGPRYEVPDGAIVVGGGLASIDVAKIINFELYGRALRALGHDVDAETFEHKGIPQVCESLGVEHQALGITGARIFYRRAKEDMPLATATDPSPEKLEKLKAARVRIMDRVTDKYLVTLEPFATPVSALTDGGRMVGLRFARTEVVDGRVKVRQDDCFDVKAPMVVSSIGSIPQNVEGVQMDGELYRWKDRAHGELEGHDNVFGLGNVLTGTGNIRDSRVNAHEIAEDLMHDYLGVGDVPTDFGQVSDAIAEGARNASHEVVERALLRHRVAEHDLTRICNWVKARWKATGYDGDYRAHIASHRLQG